MRYFIELTYNGTRYFGWQIQPNEISVQEVIEEKLSIFLRQDIRVVGAGRTDTGVHAKKYFIHFDYPEALPEDFIKRINTFLPKDIAFHKVLPAQNDGHARFDAVSRTYEYYISPYKDVFLPELSWVIGYPLDIEKMNDAAKLLIFDGDFSSFAKVHTDVKTHICNVTEAYWKTVNGQYVFTITADRFLRNMVRAVVGTLVEVGKEKLSIDEFAGIIEKKDRSFAKSSAPAQGLYLTNVKYPKELFNEQ